jgi:acetyl-CoA acetyltransferase
MEGRDVFVVGAGNSVAARDLDPRRFAAEGARNRSIMRVASAVGDGATAVRLAHEYLAAEDADELSLIAGG